MKNYDHVPSLRKYVLTKKDKNLVELKEAAKNWTKAAEENKLAYEIDWLGIPIIQTPEDIVLMQELIFKVRPDIIVEAGIAHGGSLIFYSSLMEIIGKGKVIGVDIEIREHNRKAIEVHPMSNRISLIEGSSISPEVISEVKNLIEPDSKVIICLDSAHTKDHVLSELREYSKFVPVGSYIVVFDTNSSDLAKMGACDKMYIDNGPYEAVREFLSESKNFVIDESYNKLFVSDSPNGYLKRIS